jgi:hypothetical protein
MPLQEDEIEPDMFERAVKALTSYLRESNNNSCLTYQNKLSKKRIMKIGTIELELLEEGVRKFRIFTCAQWAPQANTTHEIWCVGS